MLLEQAIQAIVEAKAMQLCFAGDERKERFLAEVTRVLTEYGDAKWHDACAATVRVLEQGGQVSGFACKLRQVSER